jgi:Tfp pilus assembly major pilin PilA
VFKRVVWQTVTQTDTQIVTQTDTQTVTQTDTQTVTQTDTQTVTQTDTQTVTQTDTQTVTQTDTLLRSRFSPTCFGMSLPSSGGRGYLRSYSSSLYCGCIWITIRPDWSFVEGCNQPVTSLDN